MKSILLFCGSKEGTQPRYATVAQQLGTTLAQRGITLIYGGGNVGLMGVAARAALAAGGRVIGVIPRLLCRHEIAHPALTELIITESMHERKAKMHTLADGIITMPGGYGTLDELFESVTWAQLYIHQKPVGLLNVAGFYDPLLQHLTQMEQEGFLLPGHRQLLLVSHTLDDLLTQMSAYTPPPPPHWWEESLTV